MTTIAAPVYLTTSQTELTARLLRDHIRQLQRLAEQYRAELEEAKGTLAIMMGAQNVG
jgi:hypothetical protein